MSSGNLMGFDANKVKPVGFDAIPAGEYTVVITKSEIKPTKNGKGQRLNLTLQVVEGQYKNRTLIPGLNIQNESAQCQQIGQGQLSQLCRAVNVMTPKDSSELHNKPLIAVVKIDKEGRNDVSAFKPVGKQSSLVEQAFEPTEQPAATTGKKSPWET